MVARRGAAHAGRDIAVTQLQAVFCMGGGWLVGEAGAIKCGKKPVAGSVAGKNSPGAIAAMSGRGQAANQDSGAGIAKSGNRTPPIDFISIGGSLFSGHLFTPAHQTRTAAARDDALIELIE